MIQFIHKPFHNLLLSITFIVSLSVSTSTLAFSDLQGKPVQLEQYIGNGQWTVVKIWASDCHVCQRTIHYLQEFEQRFPQAKVFGISIDGLEGKADAQRFIQQYKVRVPTLLSDWEEMRLYLNREAQEDLLGTPTLLVYKPDGQLLAIQPGVVTADELIAFIQREQNVGQ